MCLLDPFFFFLGSEGHAESKQGRGRVTVQARTVPSGRARHLPSVSCSASNELLEPLPFQSADALNFNATLPATPCVILHLKTLFFFSFFFKGRGAFLFSDRHRGN